MAPPPPSSLLLLSLSTLLLLLPNIHAQPAPGPSSPAPNDIIGILRREGQYTNFIRLLTDTHSDTQIDNQVNNSRDGMTVFAPTDNAFNNLNSGTLNNLSERQHVQLVQYHLLPKFYTLDDFGTVSNPVRTQASDQDGKPFGLTITARANQVNVSTGVVDVPIYNAVRRTRPLAIYQVDKVLLPKEFSEASPPEASPPPPGRNTTSTRGAASGGDAAAAPASGNSANGSGKMQVGLGLVSGICLLWVGLLI